MSNQVILWSMALLPWLTLFLMKRDDIKRFMPVALFGSITSIMIGDIGGTLKLWAFKESAFPLSHIFTYHLGLAPVLTMWLFRFTYERFWRFIAVDTILNLGFALIFAPWLAARGIRESINATSASLFLILTVHGVVLYIYQMWQENALAPAFKNLFSSKIQPTASKSLFKNKRNRNNR